MVRIPNHWCASRKLVQRRVAVVLGRRLARKVGRIREEVQRRYEGEHLAPYHEDLLAARVGEDILVGQRPVLDQHLEAHLSSQKRCN